MDSARRVVTLYFQKLEELDLDGFLSLWDDKAVQVMPFAPPGMPTRLEGKEAIRKQYGTMSAFSGMRFEDLALQPLQQPGEFFARFRGDIRLKTGGSYNNDYASRFVVRDEKLVEVDEYFNPLVLQEAFGPAANAGSPELAVQRVMETILRGTDARDWGLVAGAFAPEVVLDYGTPETLTPQGVVNRWRPIFSELNASEHVLRDVRVGIKGERAKVASAFHAWHQLKGSEGGDEWELDGTYEHDLVLGTDGWKVTRMKMTPEFEEGNSLLIAIAKQRAKAKMPSDVRSSGLKAVKAERVSFESGGERLVGLLYRPVGRPADTRGPAVIVAGTWTSVKEQMASLYASRLAEQGYITLAFDFRGYGESGGMPRDVEIPRMKIEDLRSGVGFLGTVEGVDRRQIGALGICAGAGYVAGASAEDERIRSIALVAPWLHDPELVELLYGGKEGVAAKLDAAREATRAGEPRYVPAVSAKDPNAAMPMAMNYYDSLERGRVPQWPNRFAVTAWDHWLKFNPIEFASRISVPVQIVHSESAAIPGGTRKFYDALKSPKWLLWTDGVQFDFYDQPAQVALATQTAAAHFRNTLSPRAGVRG